MIRFNFPTKLHQDWERWLLIKGTETNSKSQKERNRSVYRGHSPEKKKKNLPVQETQEAWVPPLRREDALE